MIEQQEIYYPYIGNGVTAQFAYGCRIFAPGDLVVKVAGVTKALGVDYTISGVDDPAGGAVAFVPAAIPAAGLLVELQRELEYSRPSGYAQNGDFRPETVDRDQDYQTALLQQMEYKLRHVVVPPVVVSENAAATVFVDASAGDTIYTLPASGEVVVVKTDDTANKVIIQGDGKTVSRQASVELAVQDESKRFRLYGDNWVEIK